MGNVAKEPRLSDLLYCMDMERQHETVSTLLDELPPEELENSLSNIDVSLFLGEDFDTSFVINGSCAQSVFSSDSEEFKKFSNSEDSIKLEPVSPKRHNFKKVESQQGISSETSFFIKEEILDEDETENLIGIPWTSNSFVKKEPFNNEESSVISSSDDIDSKDYTFYIAPSKKKKKGRKRQNPEYYKKRKPKLEKDIKIVIKRKEKSVETSSALVDTSATASKKMIVSASESALEIPFCDIPFSDSFSTSIAEKVKTKRRSKSSSECSAINTLNESPHKEKLSKKRKKVLDSDLKHCKGNKRNFDNVSSDRIVKGVKLDVNQNLMISNNKLLSEKSFKNKKDEFLNMPNLSMIPHVGALDVTDKFINKNKSAIGMNTIVKKTSNFHDYSKSANNNLSKQEKKTFQHMPKLFPVENKSVTLRNESTHTSPRLTFRSTSSEFIDLISNVQDSIDVPVSMAEVEIASFEEAIETPAQTKAPYTVKLRKLSDNSFSFSNVTQPVVVIAPLDKERLDNERLLNSEDLQMHLSSAESESSSSGYHCTDSSSSLVKKQALFSEDQTQKNLSESNFDFSCSSDSKRSSFCDNYDEDVQKEMNQKDYSPQSESRHSSWSKSTKTENYSINHSASPLRRSSRYHTKSPESISHLIKSKFGEETDQRLLNHEVKGGDFEARRLTFDNRKAIAERRVMYVGKIPNGITRKILEDRFKKFGKIENIQIKVRESESPTECSMSVFDHEYGDWNLTASFKGINKWKKMYAFVTFKRQADVANAIEEGKKLWPELNLNYGGRREFVKETYSDLDGNFAERIETEFGHSAREDEGFDFARELKAAQQRRGLAYQI